MTTTSTHIGSNNDSWYSCLSWMDDQNLQNEENSETEADAFVATTFCNICLDSTPISTSFDVPACQHTFCSSCILTYVLKKVNDSRYPIPCPVCLAEGQHHIIENEVLERLEIPADSRDKLNKLQLSQFAVSMTCPKCQQGMYIARNDIPETRQVVCPLPDCDYRWCCDCMAQIYPEDAAHRCRNKKFEKLMRRKGWKYCPGCDMPVQKESGCNHISCGAPGCSVHFCYKCGKLIFDSSQSRGATLSAAMSSHYLTCQQFQPRWREKLTSCSIQ